MHFLLQVIIIFLYLEAKYDEVPIFLLNRYDAQTNKKL